MNNAKRPTFACISFLALSLMATRSYPAIPEPGADALLREVLEVRDAIVAARPPDSAPAVFLAFWDFDGTILRGDCSEGLVEDGRSVYAGLAQIGIERGLVAAYPPNGGFATFWKDYQYFEHRIGPWLAYPYVAQMFRGARAGDVEAMAREHFAAVLAAYYYSGSLHVLRGLESAGVENQIISASPDIFVKAASITLRLPMARFNGIVVQIDDNGRMTSDVVLPLTLADGKRVRMLEIIDRYRRSHPGTEIFLLAAFGNSYNSDGPFLEYAARQKLPASRHGLGVMINGGNAPGRYCGLFRTISLDATIQ